MSCKSFFLFTISVCLVACGSDELTEVPTPTDPFPIVSNFVVQDVGNDNSSSDLQIAFRLDNSLVPISSHKIVFAKAAKNLTPVEAKALTGNRSIDFEIKSRIDLNLDQGIADSDGDLLTEGLDYKAYIFFENATDNEMIASTTFSILNQTVVLTLASVGADEDISLDSEGNLYVNGGSVSKKNVFKITPKGAVTPFMTSADYPVGSTFDKDGNFYVSNFESTNIYKIDNNNQLSTYITDGRFTGGGGLLVTNDGTLYNTFFSQKKISKITPDKAVSELLSSNKLSGPIGMTYDQEKEIAYVANWNDGKIFRIESDNTLSLVADTPASIGHISYANGHFYITGGMQNKVYQINETGNLVEEIGTGANASVDGTSATASFAGTNGIEATPDGKIVYVTDGGSKIRKIIMKRLE